MEYSIMMCSKEYMERAENAVLHTYNRFPVVLDRGEGVRLYDLEGNEYLDLAPVSRFLLWATETKHTTRP